MSTAPVHTAALPRGAPVAVWMDVDTWLRLQDPDPAPPQARVAVAEPEPLPDRFVELLERLDQVAAAHKRSRTDRRGGHYSGRRGALISDRELARGFYELCLVEGVAPIRRALELSRQSLQDVWIAHGWKAPGRVTQPRGSRAGGTAA
jgi:hypothetical protein